MTRSWTAVRIAASVPGGSVAAVLQLLPLPTPPPSPNPPTVGPVGSPDTAPAAPTGLAAPLVSSDRVSLTWIDNSNNEAAFAIWRRTASTDWTRVGIVPPNTTTFTDTGLQRGTTYTYRVRATNQFASDWSNEVTVTTLP